MCSRKCVTGNDISSISGQSEQENFVHSTDSTFIAGTKAGQTLLVEEAGEQTVEICSTIKAYVELAKSVVITNQATKNVYQFSIGSGTYKELANAELCFSVVTSCPNNNASTGSAAFDVAGGFDSDSVHSSHDNALSNMQANAVSLFPVPAEWHKHLIATDSVAPFAAEAFPTTATGTTHL